MSNRLKKRFKKNQGWKDDIVILGDSKEHLRNILITIKLYLKYVLKLNVKGNYQIFPVESRGIDFVGYVFRHEYRLLRKSIKTKISKLVYRYINNKISKDVFESRMTSYRGWLKFCNSKHFSDIVQHSTKYRLSTWNGELKHITSLNNVRFYIVEIIIRQKYFEIHAIRNRVPFVVRSKNKWLYKTLNKRHLPYSFKYEHSKFQYKTKRHRTTR